MMNNWENMKQEVNMYDEDDDDNSMDNCGDDDDVNNDAEGVWSPDIEQSFQEALAIYPPCGRRKIILSEEGKMYGRNELIARYIKLRTGKTRTRKQVSSHIQVLAKRKTKDFHHNTPNNNGPLNTNNKSLSTTTSSSTTSSSSTSTILTQNKSFLNFANQHHAPPPPSSSSLVASAVSLSTTPHNTSIWSHPGLSSTISNNNNNNNNTQSIQLYQQSPTHTPPLSLTQTSTTCSSSSSSSSLSLPSTNHDTSSLIISTKSSSFNNTLNNNNNLIIGTSKLRLIEFSGFLELRKEPDNYYQKHLFVHLNTELTTSNTCTSSSSILLGTNLLTNADNDDLFECINIKELADKFPDNDLNCTDNKLKISYLIKFWVDLNYTLPIQDLTNLSSSSSSSSLVIQQNGQSSSSYSSQYAVNNVFESIEPMNISCSTKVCSFGNQVVEKIESEQGIYENGRYVYRIENSPMCEYMITFINKLKSLPEKNHKNSVLENFSVLQIIKNQDTQEILLCLAYVFEVSTSEHGAQHVIYRLTK